MRVLSPVASREVPSWSAQADVVVVGFGIAGACAALEAHRAGARVLLLERAAGPGGASILSSGIFYLGGGTPVQTENGFDDDAENMYDFLRASTTAPDPEIVRSFSDNAAAHFDWLEETGVPFERTYFPGKAVVLVNTMCLFTTGNEKVWPYRELARPAPRGHKVAGSGEHAGAVGMQAIIAAVEREAIDVEYESSVTALVRDDAGAVVGVQVRGRGGDSFVRARQGVVLAAGGFTTGEQMLAEFTPGLPATAEPLGTPENDGMAIRLGESVGGALQSMDGLCVTGSFYPPSQLIRGIVVNSRGQRFVAEDSYHGRVADSIMDQPGRRAYLIVDAETFAYPKITQHGHRLIDGWETIAEMEQGLGVPAGSLERTLGDYSRHAAEGRDPQFRKHPDWLTALDHGPWAAFDISVDSSTYLYITLGGLRVNADAQVLTARGETIAGLYAAGACASTIPQNGKEYASGLSLGPGSWFGRVAGRHAAERGRQ